MARDRATLAQVLVVPIKHFVTVSRAILLKGAGVSDLWRPLTFLAAFAALMLPLAVLMCRKRTA